MKIIKGLLTASLLTVTAVTSAYASVACPSVSDVKGTVKALNVVMRQSERGFFVFTAQPAINASNLSWLILAQASAKGFDAAYASGQSAVGGVMAAATEEAIEQGGFYICPYMSSVGGLSVMAIAQQQQGLTFNPSVLNLDAITKQ